MKLICILIFVSVNIYSQTIYTTTEAAEYLGDSISVSGNITEIFTSEKGNTFLS